MTRIAREGFLMDGLPALENGLVRGVVSELPAPGAVFSAERRAAWFRLVDGVFDFVYLAGESPAEASEAVLMLEARPTGESGRGYSVPRNGQRERAALGKGLASTIPEPRAPLGPPPKEKPGAAFKMRKGEGRAVVSRESAKAPRGLLKSLIVEALRVSTPLTKVEIVHWIEKHRAKEVAHVLNVSSAVYQSLRKMVDAGELVDDVEGGKTVYLLPE